MWLWCLCNLQWRHLLRHIILQRSHRRYAVNALTTLSGLQIQFYGENGRNLFWSVVETDLYQTCLMQVCDFVQEQLQASSNQSLLCSFCKNSLNHPGRQFSGSPQMETHVNIFNKLAPWQTTHGDSGICVTWLERFIYFVTSLERWGVRINVGIEEYIISVTLRKNINISV